jgi:hypothetical protein
MSLWSEHDVAFGHYRRYDAPVIAVMEMPRHEISHYGVVNPEHIEPDLVRMKDFVEKPAPEDAPSNLGLRPPEPGVGPGVYKLAGALRDAGFVTGIGESVRPRRRTRGVPGRRSA